MTCPNCGEDSLKHMLGTGYRGFECTECGAKFMLTETETWPSVEELRSLEEAVGRI